ncbi:hypothetical protein F5880DRAFT_1619115 [Lentinula raphanica]|nr:hypothetical protein F5880DRAFT_1619115 [Lentinula raphanica]
MNQPLPSVQTQRGTGRTIPRRLAKLAVVAVLFFALLHLQNDESAHTAVGTLIPSVSAAPAAPAVPKTDWKAEHDARQAKVIAVLAEKPTTAAYLEHPDSIEAVTIAIEAAKLSPFDRVFDLLILSTYYPLHSGTLSLLPSPFSLIPSPSAMFRTESIEERLTVVLDSSFSKHPEVQQLVKNIKATPGPLDGSSLTVKQRLELEGWGGEGEDSAR